MIERVFGLFNILTWTTIAMVQEFWVCTKAILLEVTSIMTPQKQHASHFRCRNNKNGKHKLTNFPAVWREQNLQLTRFGVWVSITLSAAVGWCLFIVLFLRKAEGKRLGSASRAARLRVSEPTVTATLLGSIWKMECHTALGLEHTNKQEMFY